MVYNRGYSHPRKNTEGLANLCHPQLELWCSFWEDSKVVLGICHFGVPVKHYYRSSVFPLRVSTIQVAHYLVSRIPSWPWNSTESKSTSLQHVHALQAAYWLLV